MVKTSSKIPLTQQKISKYIIGFNQKKHLENMIKLDEMNKIAQQKYIQSEKKYYQKTLQFFWPKIELSKTQNFNINETSTLKKVDLQQEKITKYLNRETNNY